MLTVNELFSGIGAFRKALIRLHIPHEIVGISEIDKYAIQSYNAMYGETFNYGDISKIEKLNYADLWTYGFPCQDISIAGEKKGIVKNETRSGLLYEVERLLQVSIKQGEAPKYLIMENVKNLVGKKFIEQFDGWIKELDQFGYYTYWKVLNAKDYGIPQNRERVFAISIRKDISVNFIFPKKMQLNIRLKDVLDDKVDKKFYLKKALNLAFKEKYIQYDNSGKGYDSQACRLYYQDGLCPTLPAKNSGDKSQVILMNKSEVEPKIHQVTNIVNTGNWDNPQRGRIYSSEGISPALNTCGGGGLEPKIIEAPELKIRKLTPKECWRLMGFDDSDFEKAEKVCSNTQLYKQAGNSIVVNVLEKLLYQLLIAPYLL